MAHSTTPAPAPQIDIDSFEEGAEEYEKLKDQAIADQLAGSRADFDALLLGDKFDRISLQKEFTSVREACHAYAAEHKSLLATQPDDYQIKDWLITEAEISAAISGVIPDEAERNLFLMEFFGIDGTKLDDTGDARLDADDMVVQGALEGSGEPVPSQDILALRSDYQQALDAWEAAKVNLTAVQTNIDANKNQNDQAFQVSQDDLGVYLSDLKTTQADVFAELGVAADIAWADVDISKLPDIDAKILTLETDKDAADKAYQEVLAQDGELKIDIDAKEAEKTAVEAQHTILKNALTNLQRLVRTYDKSSKTDALKRVTVQKISKIFGSIQGVSGDIVEGWTIPGKTELKKWLIRATDPKNPKKGWFGNGGIDVSEHQEFDPQVGPILAFATSHERKLKVFYREFSKNITDAIDPLQKKRDALPLPDLITVRDTATADYDKTNTLKPHYYAAVQKIKDLKTAREAITYPVSQDVQGQLVIAQKELETYLKTIDSSSLTALGVSVTDSLDTVDTAAIEKRLDAKIDAAQGALETAKTDQKRAEQSDAALQADLDLQAENQADVEENMVQMADVLKLLRDASNELLHSKPPATEDQVKRFINSAKGRLVALETKKNDTDHLLEEVLSGHDLKGALDIAGIGLLIVNMKVGNLQDSRSVFNSRITAVEALSKSYSQTQTANIAALNAQKSAVGLPGKARNVTAAQTALDAEVASRVDYDVVLNALQTRVDDREAIIASSKTTTAAEAAVGTAKDVKDKAAEVIAYERAGRFLFRATEATMPVGASNFAIDGSSGDLVWDVAGTPGSLSGLVDSGDLPQDIHGKATKDIFSHLTPQQQQDWVTHFTSPAFEDYQLKHSDQLFFRSAFKVLLSENSSIVSAMDGTFELQGADLFFKHADANGNIIQWIPLTVNTDLGLITQGELDKINALHNAHKPYLHAQVAQTVALDNSFENEAERTEVLTALTALEAPNLSGKEFATALEAVRVLFSQHGLDPASLQNLYTHLNKLLIGQPNVTPAPVGNVKSYVNNLSVTPTATTGAGTTAGTKPGGTATATPGAGTTTAGTTTASPGTKPPAKPPVPTTLPANPRLNERMNRPQWVKNSFQKVTQFADTFDPTLYPDMTGDSVINEHDHWEVFSKKTKLGLLDEGGYCLSFLNPVSSRDGESWSPRISLNDSATESGCTLEMYYMNSFNMEFSSVDQALSYLKNGGLKRALAHDKKEKITDTQLRVEYRMDNAALDIARTILGKEARNKKALPKNPTSWKVVAYGNEKVLEIGNAAGDTVEYPMNFKLDHWMAHADTTPPGTEIFTDRVQTILNILRQPPFAYSIVSSPTGAPGGTPVSGPTSGVVTSSSGNITGAPGKTSGPSSVPTNFNVPQWKANFPLDIKPGATLATIRSQYKALHAIPNRTPAQQKAFNNGKSLLKSFQQSSLAQPNLKVALGSALGPKLTPNILSSIVARGDLDLDVLTGVDTHALGAARVRLLLSNPAYVETLATAALAKQVGRPGGFSEPGFELFLTLASHSAWTPLIEKIKEKLAVLPASISSNSADVIPSFTLAGSVSPDPVDLDLNDLGLQTHQAEVPDAFDQLFSDTSSSDQLDFDLDSSFDSIDASSDTYGLSPEHYPSVLTMLGNTEENVKPFTELSNLIGQLDDEQIREALQLPVWNIEGIDNPRSVLESEFSNIETGTLPQNIVKAWVVLFRANYNLAMLFTPAKIRDLNTKLEAKLVEVSGPVLPDLEPIILPDVDLSQLNPIDTQEPIAEPALEPVDLDTWPDIEPLPLTEEVLKSLEGLSEQDLEISKEILSGNLQRMEDLTALRPAVAEQIAVSCGGGILTLPNLLRLDVDSAKMLVSKESFSHLSLDGLTTLDVAVAEQLALLSNLRILSLNGLTSFDMEEARHISSLKNLQRLNLNDVSDFSTALAMVINWNLGIYISYDAGKSSFNKPYLRLPEVDPN